MYSLREGKGVACEGESEGGLWVNIWSDEHKSHIKYGMRIRLLCKEKSDNR